MLPVPTSDGRIYNEWTDGLEDKALIATSSEIDGYNFPVNESAGALDAPVSITPGIWHHVAYVYDSTWERIFLDGTEVAVRQASGNVGNASGLGFIGAIARDGTIVPAIHGYLASIRLSDTARYTTNFVPPPINLGSDSNTLLLYNFNDATIGTTVEDESSYGRTGYLGVGFAGATSPVVASVPTVLTTQVPTIAPPSQQSQLLVFNGKNAWSSSIVPQENENTIIITPGWNNKGPGDWPLQMAEDIEKIDPAVNILTWDWQSDANSPDAGMLVPSEGTGLAISLLQELPGYTGQLHLIGHSIGSLVDREAINDILANGIAGSQIDDTILDAPEVDGEAFVGMSVANSNPIPNLPIAHIDNYITSFGKPHPEAENILLTQGAPAGLIGGHEYSHEWYDQTVQQNLSGIAGFGSTPQAGTYYVQSANPLTPQTLDQTNELGMQSLLTARNIFRVSFLSVDAVNGAVQVAGNVIANLETKLQPTAPLASDQTPVSTPSIQLNGDQGSYCWVPMTIPANTEGLSFNTLFHDVPAGDSLTIGIGNQVLYSVDGADATDDTTASNTVNVSQWAGQVVQLFMGLFPGTSPSAEITPADETQSDESVTIDGIEFDFQALLGDADGNGMVDAADLSILKDNLGLSVTGGYADGDFNGDGIVNADDFSLFMEGLAEYQASLATVPEPGVAAMVLASGLFLASRRRRN